MCKDGTFMGFILYTPVDTTLTPGFKAAIASYSGPKVKVNSLKRRYNVHSDHFHGNAADLEFSSDLIEWLVSTNGKE